MDGTYPSEALMREWPSVLTSGFKAQMEIESEHILFGQLAKQWDIRAQYCPHGNGKAQPGQWTNRAV